MRHAPAAEESISPATTKRADGVEHAAELGGVRRPRQRRRSVLLDEGVELRTCGHTRPIERADARRLRRRRREEEERRQEEELDAEPESNKRLTFLDLMLKAQRDGTGISDKEIREEVDMIIFAVQNLVVRSSTCSH